MIIICFFFFSSRRRHTRYIGDWSSDVCSSDLHAGDEPPQRRPRGGVQAVRRRPRRRSEERRVGKECRSRWSPYHSKKKKKKKPTCAAEVGPRANSTIKNTSTMTT